MDKSDLLKWWLHHKKRFPILAEVVREVFAIPASSATSERVFSVGTQVKCIISANVNGFSSFCNYRFVH